MSSINKKRKSLLGVVIIIIALIVLFFVFKNLSPEEKITKGTEVGDLNSLNVGENPDLEVDDFNALQISNEEISE